MAIRRMCVCVYIVFCCIRRLRRFRNFVDNQFCSHSTSISHIAQNFIADLCVYAMHTPTNSNKLTHCPKTLHRIWFSRRDQKQQYLFANANNLYQMRIIYLQCILYPFDSSRKQKHILTIWEDRQHKCIYMLLSWSHSSDFEFIKAHYLGPKMGSWDQFGWDLCKIWNNLYRIKYAFRNDLYEDIVGLGIQEIHVASFRTITNFQIDFFEYLFLKYLKKLKSNAFFL